ncbi:MAG: hypothetical protein MI862_11190 [Desulfobacterales bacterium]|nr:hypothetical protein [Desulfobacterales bacterium]
MKKDERIRAALDFQEVDRIPLSIWLHYPHMDQDPRSLAETQVNVLRKYDYDFIKLMPFGLYSVQDWGCKIKISGSPHDPHVVDDYGIKDIKDWQMLEELPAIYGTWGKQLQLAQYVDRLLNGDTPFIQTVFSPLTTARKLAGDRIFKDIKHHPGIVHDALDVITTTTINFVKANIDAGVSGFFFATQCATYDLMTDETYEEFGQKYDLRVFSHFQHQTYFNVLHIHGRNTMFEKLISYPANCLNWHDRWSPPSLGEARRLTNKCLLGGIHERNILVSETPEAVQAHVEEAVLDAGKRGFILGPGCVADPATPKINYFAARLALERV